MFMMNLIGNKEADEYCRKRVNFLKLKFDMHLLLNERVELEQQKRIESVDFTTVHKVDTHIHAAGCMTQQHLIDFIRKKLSTEGDFIVCSNYKPLNRDASLIDIFTDLGLNIDKMDLDSLGMRATRELYCRFDRLNQRFRPFEVPILRDLFMKVDNEIEGVYFAQIIKEVFEKLERSKYINYELRISVYGRSYAEWDNLARWFFKNEMFSANNRWMIQIPKIYDLLKANKQVDNFGQILDNFFRPLFEVTLDPQTHPQLHELLKHISGFDSVDDESKIETLIFDEHTANPAAWTSDHNPPYSYYIYYFYANLQVLNQLRKLKSLNTFSNRPHCGESGSIFHLVIGYLLAENISHGIVIKNSNVLQYLYYLCRVGIAASPSSNHYLYLSNVDNPFYDLHKIGLNLSVSSDSPLHFSFDQNALIEEYAVLSKIWTLSSVDICELARNSVLMSGFTNETKQKWLGHECFRMDTLGNDESKSNIPSIRVAYRHQTLLDELKLLFQL